MKGVGIIWTHNKFSQTLINFRFEVNLFIEKFEHFKRHLSIVRVNSQV